MEEPNASVSPRLEFVESIAAKHRFCYIGNLLVTSNVSADDGNDLVSTTLKKNEMILTKKIVRREEGLRRGQKRSRVFDHVKLKDGNRERDDWSLRAGTRPGPSSLLLPSRSRSRSH